MRPPLRRRLQDPIDEVEELDGALVRVQLLMVEHAPVVAPLLDIVAPKPGTGTGTGTGTGRRP